MSVLSIPHSLESGKSSLVDRLKRARDIDELSPPVLRLILKATTALGLSDWPILTVRQPWAWARG